MMFRPILVTPPAESPVTLGEAKARCVVGFDDDDTLIGSLRDAAVTYLDGFRGVLGRGIVNQTWELQLSGWQRSFILPVPDVSAASVIYADKGGTVHNGPDVTLTPIASGVRVGLPGNFAFPAASGDIWVRFTMGFGGAADVPASIKLAITSLVSHWYENSGKGDQGIPVIVSTLIAPYRWVTP
jgi:uncharacterized phiE125 gp8 family phage protein